MMSILSAQAIGELKRLSNRTVSAAGVASQGSLNRQQMVELLQFATGNFPPRAHPIKVLSLSALKLPKMIAHGIAAFSEGACVSGVHKRLSLCG